MAKVVNLKRIVVEDYAKEDQDTVTKLAFSLNPLVDELSNAFNKNIDFDNLNQQYSTFTVTVDGTGKPTSQLQIKYELKTRMKGIHVISAQNLTDTTYPTAAPFISWSFASNLITVNNIAGLPANKQFQLSVVIIG